MTEREREREIEKVFETKVVCERMRVYKLKNNSERERVGN